MAVNIPALPGELIAHIFSFLEDQDVLSARLVHKQIEKASFAHFGKRFFRKKGYMLTTSSLDVLISIAQHSALSKYVQHVWFNPDCYTFARPACARVSGDAELSFDSYDVPEMSHSDTALPSDDILAMQYDAWTQCMEDHLHLLYSPDLERKLTVAFGALSDLKTVGMRRSEDYSPYGWRKLEQDIGTDPRVLGLIPSGPMSQLSRPTQLFVALIRAIASTGVKLQRLYTDAVEVDNIEAASLPQESLDLACSSIQYMELNVIKGRLSEEPQRADHAYNVLANPGEYGNGVVRVLKAMPRLKEIGLQIFRDIKQRHLVPPTRQDPESWRLSYPYLTLTKLVDHVTFNHLTRFKFEKVTTSPDCLMKILTPSATSLTSLKIRNIRLLSSPPEARPWQTFLTFLVSECQSLHFVLLSHLMYHGGGISFAEVLSPVLSDEVDRSETHSYVIYGGRPVYVDWEHITVLERGREDVRSKLEQVKEKHWYHKPLFSFDMDDALWHTDTSGEEW